MINKNLNKPLNEYKFKAKGYGDHENLYLYTDVPFEQMGFGTRVILSQEDVELLCDLAVNVVV